MFKMLIVEDEVTIRHGIKAWFSKSKFEIVEAADGRVALELLKNEKLETNLHREYQLLAEGIIGREKLNKEIVIMHPGPINRGVEMIVDPSLVPGSRILQQVTNGISIRMAVLFSLLGGDATTTLQNGVEA